MRVIDDGSHIAMSRSWRCALAAAVLFPAVAIAQALPLDSQLPAWAAKPWAAAATANRIEAFGGVNPFYQRGDFDGDGKSDLAILVREKATGKIGILVLHRVGKPVLLGAGRAFGNGGDDFAWLDQWSVDDGAADARRTDDSSGSRRPDGLFVAKEGAASAVIRYRNGKYFWRQQGD
jgi:hypothetical protein